VRLIAATNQDLEAAVAAGRFREDLYYRLRVVDIAIPPLRERREDVPLLIERFLAAAAARFQRPPKPLADAALRACLAHDWKGNVRELKSTVEQALLLAPGDAITVADLFPGNADAAARADGACPDSTDAEAPASGSFRDAKERAVAHFEREFLLQALRRHDGNITKAAEEIGMYRQNLQQKMRELGISSDAAAKAGRDDAD